MLARIARFCFRHRKLVVLFWVLTIVGMSMASGAVGTNYRTDFRLPDSESKNGFAILNDEYGGAGGFGGTFVYKADKGIDDPEVKAAIEKMIEESTKIAGVASITSPYSEEGASQRSVAGPLAGKVAFARVQMKDGLQQEDFATIADKVRETIPKTAGLQTELGSEIFGEFEPPESEVIGIAFAIVILVLAFGSVLAMGLPIGVALAGIGIGAAVVTFLSHLMSMPDFTLTLGLMIGLGVGIDYALFIVTRWREAVHEGENWEEATVIALSTAGRAVMFAGVTVVISLMGMLLMGLAFVRGLAIGASIVVVFTLAASITLLPALLGLAKHRVELTRYRGLIGAAALSIGMLGVGLKIKPLAVAGLVVAVMTALVGLIVTLLSKSSKVSANPFVKLLQKTVPRRAPKPNEQTFWYKWSRIVQRRPWPMAIFGFAVLLLASVPVLSLRLGVSDEGNYAAETTTKKAYDLLATGFGPGFNGPLVLAALVPEGVDPAKAEAITTALQQDPGVAFAAPAIPSQSGKALLWQVIPKTSPQSVETEDLVHRLRDTVLPALETTTGIRPNVTGNVAGNIDFADYLAKRLPLFFGAVLALSFLLLMAVFRSLLVPLKAVIMNLLSIGAAYGVVVAVFQWGWLKDLFGLGAGAPIEPWAPMMMFAIVFGLSMDYEVFLMSRMREEFDRHGDNAKAVADGLASTARVITAAAAIMVFVFGSFLLESNRQIKLFGLGLAMAVFLDATIVRMVLVPATMELLGARNWWLPSWLDKLLPRLDVEGGTHAEKPKSSPKPVGSN
jgi:putative drug exporter of the RND superfamily